MNGEGPWTKYQQQDGPWTKYRAKSPAPEVHDPTAGMSGPEKFFAGVGKGMVDIGRGVGERLGLLSQEDIAEARRLDEPLHRTGAGRFGEAVGDVAAAAPAALLPGAGSLAGAAAIGGALGAAQPTVKGESVLRNVGEGAAGGLAGGALGKLVTKAARAAPQVLKDAINAGYKLPPKDIASSGAATRALGSWSGKIKTEHAASIRNQEVTNDLARRELGMPKDAPITAENLQKVRDRAGQAYEAIKRQPQPFAADKQYLKDVAQIGYEDAGGASGLPQLGGEKIEELRGVLRAAEIDPGRAVDWSRQLRHTGNVLSRSADPEQRAIGKARLDGAKAIENLVDRELTARGKPELLGAFREARKKIAQTWDVARAADAAGNVSAVKLAKKADKMTGHLKTAAQFGANFPKSAQLATKLGGEERYSILDLISADALGVGAALAGSAAGHPSAAAAALLPVLRPVARATVLSRSAQRLMAADPSRAGQAARAAIRRSAPYVLGDVGATEQAP